MIRLFLYATFFTFFSYPSLAFDKALDTFKKDIDEAIKEFEKEIKKLPKPDSAIAESLDLAGKEFGDLLLFAKESLSGDNINATLDSIEFLDKNIDAAVKLIPPETLTSMEDVDFTTFSEEDMETLGAIMTDMNRKKMEDFKDMVTTMVVLEKEGFAAEDFMAEMQDLDMGLAMLNDESMNIDFELAGLSSKSLGDVTNQLERFDNDLQDFKAQQLIEKVAKASRSINTTSTTEEVTSSIADTNVAEVTVQVEVTVDSSVVNEATEEIATTVAESNVSEVTEEVVAVVEESNIAEQVQETTKEVEEIVYSFTNTSTGGMFDKTLTFTAEEISKAQIALIDAGILYVSNDINRDWDMSFSLSTKIDELSDIHGLLSLEDVNSLQEDLKNQVIDLALSSGRFDGITETAQAQIMCEAGKNVQGGVVTVGGAKGTNLDEAIGFTVDDRFEGKYDCGKL